MAQYGQKKGGQGRRNNQKPWVNWGFAVVVSLLAAVFGLVTTSDYLGLEGIPTWEELLEQTQLAPAVAPVEGELSVHVLDVGQGDSILIKTPENNILIDAGESEYGEQVVDYLHSQAVDYLDVVIVTHPHADHMGAMGYVVEQMEVGRLVMPKVPENMTPTTRAYERLLNAAAGKGMKISRPVLGRPYDLGDGAALTLVGPVEPDEEMNNNSIVARLTYGDTAFLFTGDCEKSMERQILETGAALSADVLKVGHHGSSTSTGGAFLEAISPQYAVISCGVDNSYGHPSRETVQRLEKAGVEICRTDLDGTIIFVSDGISVTASARGK